VAPATPTIAPQPDDYTSRLLGIQPLPATAPGGLPPPAPPRPSQSHIPLNLPIVVPENIPQIAGIPLEFHPTLGFSEEYTDNFHLTSTDKTQNFRSMLSPGLNLLLNGARTKGLLTGSLGIAQDTVNHFGDFGIFANLAAQARHTFDPRLAVNFTESYTRSDDPSLGNQFGLRQQRETFSNNTLGLSSDWFIGPVGLQGYYQLSTFFSDSSGNTITNIAGIDGGIPLGRLSAFKAGYEFQQSHTSNTNDPNAITDSTGNLIWASLSRQLGPLLTGGVQASYQFLSIDNARIGNVSLFATYELIDRLSLSGTIGYSRLTSDAGGDFGTVSTNTALTYRFARASVTLSFVQDLQQTFTQGQNFGVTLTRSYSGTFTYAFTPLLSGGAHAGYSQSEPTGVGNTGSNSNTLTAGAGVAWRVRPWLTASLDYTYNRYLFGFNTVDTNVVQGSTATENRVALRLSSSF
jgi:hypothetical protein